MFNWAYEDHPAGALAIAKARRGHWKIRTFFRPRFPFSHCECWPGRVVDVVYTEAEFAALWRCANHGTGVQLQRKNIHGNLISRASQLWPTGSEEHMAMQMLGPRAVLDLVEARTRPYGCCNVQRIECIRIDTSAQWGRVWSSAQPPRPVPPPGPPPGDDGPPPPPPGGRPPTPMGGAPDGAADPAGEQTQPACKGPPDSSGTAQPSGGGPADIATDAEATICLTQQDHTCRMCGGTAIVGTIWKDGVPRDEQTAADPPRPEVKICGVMVAPMAQPPTIYENCRENVQAAKVERVDKARRELKITPEMKARVGKMVRVSMTACEKKGVFSTKRVQNWLSEHASDLSALKSGKWSNSRFAQSMERLLEVSQPEYEVTAAIKAEPMPGNKPPRLLLADGDPGQLMCLVVVKCFEELLFSHFEDKSIKHLPKMRAVRRAMSKLLKKGAGVVEGDGSAWDTTCGDDVRNAVENPILYHITEIAIKMGLCPEEWGFAHMKECTKAKLKALFRDKAGLFKLVMDAIRRSGHRGTSCLNFWINFVMWTCAIFPEPELFLDPTRRQAVDVTGQTRWWSGVFEGDDSACTLYPKMKDGDALALKFLKWWSDWGFNMKIVFVQKRLTFVGIHIACRDGELISFDDPMDEMPDFIMAPEIPRCFKNAGASCSTRIRLAVVQGNQLEVRRIAKASCIARAHSFKDVCPTIARKFLRYGEELVTGEVEDRDMSMDTYGVEGMGTTPLIEEIETACNRISPADEMMYLEALGFGCSEDALATFEEYVWDYDNLTDFAGFRESLPVAWR